MPYGDVDALAAAVAEQTAMVLLEPMLGEGGVLPAPPGYLAAAAAAAATTPARCSPSTRCRPASAAPGHWFAHQADGLAARRHHPGQGARRRAADGRDCSPSARRPTCSTAGAHGSTFGGNPIAAAAALAVLDTIRDEGLLERAKELEHRFTAGIEGLGHPGISGVRGRGALLGVVLTADVAGALEAQPARRRLPHQRRRARTCSGSPRRSCSPTRRSTPSSPPCPPPSTRHWRPAS